MTKQKALPGAPLEALEPFKEWLTHEGGELLPTTNQWEVLRFKAGNKIGVVYTSKKAKAAGLVSACNPLARGAWLDFVSGRHLARTGFKPEKWRTRSQQIIKALIDRDGERCWYCDGLFAPKEAIRMHSPQQHPKAMTVEHVVSIAHGGPHHLSNMVLAHTECNLKAGNKSVAEKVKLREEMRRGRQG